MVQDIDSAIFQIFLRNSNPSSDLLWQVDISTRFILLLLSRKFKLEHKIVRGQII